MIPRTLLPRSAHADQLAKYSDIALAGQDVFGFRGRWSERLAGKIGPKFGGRVILDLGCADAAFLASIAAEHSETAFIGIDWKCKAICDGAALVQSMELNNVMLLRARGQDLAAIFGPAELGEIWLFHPDPCDRKAEVKNRLMNPRFLQEVHAILKDGESSLTLKTDHLDYFESAMQAVADPIIREQFDVAISSLDFWNDPPAIAHSSGRFFAGRRTRFEDRFLKKKRPIYFLHIGKKLSA